MTLQQFRRYEAYVAQEKPWMYDKGQVTFSAVKRRQAAEEVDWHDFRHAVLTWDTTAGELVCRFAEGAFNRASDDTRVELRWIIRGAEALWAFETYAGVAFFDELNLDILV